MKRRMPLGAEVMGDETHFRVWAPKRQTIEVMVDGRAHTLMREADGYFAGAVRGVGDGALYRYRLDGDGQFPDPASRHQPEGPHGPSRVVDPARFPWTDAGWKGPRGRPVLYEMHVGTWTPEGTWAAATARLADLVDLGITTVEMMPVHEFPGRWSWGYDGVDLFAPAHVYGTPDDLRRFVDRAHALGLGVILDVVYNHLGPDGNYLAQFSDDYVTAEFETDWGEALHFGSRPVRELFVSNAGYWVDEFHFDGLRFDATQNIYDDASAVHVLGEMATEARRAAGGRPVFLVAENEPQEMRGVGPVAEGGFGLDALWNDDFHHSAIVALTGRREAYYADYQGSAQELLSAVKWGFLYQGQHYAWQKQRRGTPALGAAPATFVQYLENHDQVANSGLGQRLHQRTSPGRFRAMTALTLLAPATPMLFQGQEWSSSRPFLYFADHVEELRPLVRNGRIEFLRQFPSLAELETADPIAPDTFERCKLDWRERDAHGEVYALHRDLIALRREDPVLATPRFDGAVIGDRALVLRWFGANDEARLLIVNLGPDLTADSIPEPLLAPPTRAGWRLTWSSESPTYGGSGTATPEDDDGRLRILGESAVVLSPREPA